MITIRRRPVPAESGHWPDEIPPLLRRIYTARGAFTADEARPRLANLHPPELLDGMPAAVQHLAAAIAEGKRILVVGDFDCDGATACALAVRGLRLLGARDVHHAVPNRAIHGYGLSPALVAELAPIAPDVLVTVDHGIACHAGIAAAKALGWRVIVTDHHLPGEHLPPADAIVNPNLAGDPFPSKALAGVGVIFYVLMALRRHLRETGAFTARHPEPDLMTLLDLVAIGTVADLVPLDANNRALVSAGLRRLRAGHGCTGLRALIEVAGRKPAQLTATDIGFALGPRLNAAGRLEDMGIGIELLLTEDQAQAKEIASTLQQINAERRAVQQQMTGDAEAILTRLSADTAEPPIAACLFDPDWHPGVVGLVASKMKDRLHRPVIVFAPATPGADTLRGSARSIRGLNIRDVLAAMDAAHPNLIDKFGGHAMAAGLSLPLARLESFTNAFQHTVTTHADPAILHAELTTDGALNADDFTSHHARLLRDAGPWGQGFPEPSFDGEFEILDTRIVGTNHLKLRLRPAAGGPILNAIHFGGAEQAISPREHLVYRLEPDDYRGGDAIQLLIEYRQPVPMP